MMMLRMHCDNNIAYDDVDDGGVDDSFLLIPPSPPLLLMPLLPMRDCAGDNVVITMARL